MFEAHVICRFSTQDKEDASIDRQKERCLEVAKGLGCVQESVKVIANDNLSGGLSWDKRIDLQELEKDIRDGQCKRVIVYRFDRLSRDFEVSGRLLNLLKSHSIELHDENGKLEYESASGQAFFGMKAVFAGLERAMIKERTYAGRKQKAKSGHYVGGAIPLGYVLDDNKHLPDGTLNPNYRKLKPYPPHAEIVRDIFHCLKADGASPFSVALALNKQGKVIPEFEPTLIELMKGRTAPRKQNQTGGGYRITPRIVQDISVNPVYVGIWRWGKDISLPSNHEAIVDEETFWSVSKRVMRGSCRKGKAAYTEPLPLSGLLYCVEHHNQVQAHSKSNVYICQGLYKKAIEDKSHFCFSSYVLEDAITEVVVKQCSYPEYASEVLNKIEVERDGWMTRMADAQKTQRRLQQEIENLKNGLPMAQTQQEVAYFLDGIRTREHTLAELNAETQQSRKDILGAAEITVVRDFLTNIFKYWDRLPNTLKNRFLRLILKRIDVTFTKGDSNTRVAIHWRTGRTQQVLIRWYSPWVKPDWSAEEDRTLSTMWLDGSVADIQEAMPGRTWLSIKRKAQKLGLERRVGQNAKTYYATWQPSEELLIRRFRNGELSLVEVVSLTGRTPRAIQEKASRMRLEKGLNKRIGVSWTVEDSLIPIDMSLSASGCSLPRPQSGLRRPYQPGASRGRYRKALHR
jgi:DNA invertase Pin-like site-specific DNA recombinase